MKIHILRCESFDSYASITDRLKWVKAGRVLLVMPEKDPPDLSRADLARLKHQAAGLHVALALVSRDAGLRKMALSAGVTVFDDSEDARQADWPGVNPALPITHRPEVSEKVRKHQRSEPSQPRRWVRWPAFCLAMFAVLALLAMFLPGAKVGLNLPREEQVFELIVPASMNTSAPDLITGIPLYKISMEVSASIEQKTSGTVSVGDQPATGRVIFTNMTDQSLVIPAGAIVRSLQPALRFSVAQAGTLAAGPGSTVTLAVEEMDGSGPAGNLPAGAIVAMDPPLGLSVSVTNPEALGGGTRKDSPALAQADLLAGEGAIEDALKSTFMEEVVGSIPEDARLIGESIVLDSMHVDSTPPPYDRPLTLFEISKDAKLSGYYYQERDLMQWALLASNASLTNGRILATPFPQVETISLNYEDETQATISIRANGQTIPAFSPDLIAVQLQGLKMEEAASLISEQLIPGSQPVITLSPGWWPWLPFIPQRIEING
jgi:hypothetical protein